MAIEITDEMRQAVLAELCETQGHALDMTQAFVIDNQQKQVVGSPDKEKLPHIRCVRCGRTWLVLETPGTSYDDADTKFRDRLKDSDPDKQKKPVKPK